MWKKFGLPQTFAAGIDFNGGDAGSEKILTAKNL